MQKDLPKLPADPHSAALPNEVRTTHLDLQLTLDFEGQFASGAATHTIERVHPDAMFFIVDTHGLDVLEVSDDSGQWLPHWNGRSDPQLGTPLKIGLRDGTKQVRIAYRTTAAGEAMQWLGPEQTDGGKAPFLFTQGQSIFTRSWIPLQDSPAVRITWRAEIGVPDGLVAVMSGNQRRVDGEIGRAHV